MAEHMTTIRVSDRGQLCLPAPARHRWHLDSGGEVGALDLGDAVLLVPGGADAARAALADALRGGAYLAAVNSIADQDLQTQ